MDEPVTDPLDALCLAAAPQRERRRDPEAELARVRVLSRVSGAQLEPRVSLGRFDVVRCIGRGGMGKVFEARDRVEGGPVALKVLHDPSDQALARLKREFRALRDLIHPHLVPMYELHVEHELPFFTMELIDGPSLQQRLEQGAWLDTGAVTRALLQLTEALTVLHERGTLHGDVKPSNILVRSTGALVLVDFGVAFSLSDHGSSSASGTPAYMAPERARGLPPSAASDWYAVGAVLAQLLARLPDSEREGEQARVLRKLSTGLMAPAPEQRSDAREILAALGSHTPPSRAATSVQTVSLVGRDSELSWLQRALARVIERPLACAVRGEAGIGKTALVEHFLAHFLAMAEPGVLALRGRCYEDESLPYKGFEGVVDDLATYLMSLPHAERCALVPTEAAALFQVFPGLRRVWPALGPELHRERSLRARRFAFAALSELLANVALQRKLVLFLDDLQWGDADGAALLSHLLTEPAAPLQLVIGTYRSDASGPCVRALLAATAEPPLTLGPLATEACDDLARQVSGNALHPQRRDALMRESGGSPLLLHALLRAQPAPAHAAPRYAQLMTDTLERLPDGARELLVLVALAGSPADLELLGAAAAGDSPRKWLPTLRAQHLVRSVPREAGLGLLPHHDRIRELVVARLGPAQRRAYHGRLARAAEGIALDDPEFLAHHLYRADELAAAAPYAEQAGDRARRAMALERARELYTRALACRAPERPADLVAKLAEVAAAAGDLQLAAPLFLEAAATLPAHDWSLRLRAAEVCLLRGAEAEGMSLLRPAMRQAGVPVPENMRHAIALCLWSLARCAIARKRAPSADVPDDVETEAAFRIGYMLMLHDPKGVALTLWSAARALHRGSAAQHGRALATLAHAYSLLGLRTPAEQDAMLERALALTEAAPLAHVTTLTCKALVTWGRCQCDVALASLERVTALITAQRLDAYWILGHAHAVAGSASVLAGDFQRIRAFAPGAERDAQEQGNRPVLMQIQSWRAWASMAAGDPSAMRRHAESARKEWHSARLTPMYGIAVWGECHRLLYENDLPGALALMRAEAPRFARAGLTRTQMWRISLTQLWGTIELACSWSARDAHHRAAARHARQLLREPVPCGKACGALLQAGLDRRSGHTQRAALGYGEAKRTFAALGMRGYAAVSAWHERELTRGDQANEQSLDWFTAQGIAEPRSWIRMLAP